MKKPTRPPHLRFIHIHQLFSIQYTCFELDAVNVDWWICAVFCLELSPSGTGRIQAVVVGDGSIGDPPFCCKSHI